MGFWGSVSCSCFHVFYFEVYSWFLFVSRFPFLHVFMLLVPLLFVSCSDWFPSHVSCFPLVCSCHVTLIVFIISHNVVIVPGRVLTLYLLSVSLVCFMPSQVKSLFVFWISRLSINCTWVPMDAELGPGLKRLIASVMDPPLMSVREVDIPVVSSF